MSFEEFQATVVAGGVVPAGLSGALQALWLDARGEWDKAHDAAQADGSRDGAWVHAYLHRKEGDEGNAGYWYARAGRPAVKASVTLADEWAQLVRALLTTTKTG